MVKDSKKPAKKGHRTYYLTVTYINPRIADNTINRYTETVGPLSTKKAVDMTIHTLLQKRNVVGVREQIPGAICHEGNWHPTTP